MGGLGESPLRRLLGGTGGMAVAGAGLMLVGLLFFGAVLTSPGAWQWWSARTVVGREAAGVVTYSVAGTSYSVDDGDSLRSGTRTVYYDPSDPAVAATSVAVAQASDTAVTVGPVVAGAVLVVLAIWRRNRSRRLVDERILAAGDRAFGVGIDPGTLERIMARRDVPGRPRPGTGRGG